MLRKTLIAFLLVASGAFYLSFPKQDIPFIAFDDAMQKPNPSFIDCYQGERAAQWKLVKGLYEKHLSSRPTKKLRIPKKIHQIWIGGDLPQKYERLQKTWLEMHPTWEYKLWTDADLPNFPFSDRERFDRAVNLGEKSDILRYEILREYGGLYVDTDFECVKAFDELHTLCDFYVGLEASFIPEAEAAIGNALIASIPNHPILEFCLKRIGKTTPATNPDEVQDKTGPGCLRRAYFKCCKKKNLKNIAFPSTFFYPLPSKNRDGSLGESKEIWLEPESFGIHYWDTSWGSKAF